MAMTYDGTMSREDHAVSTKCFDSKILKVLAWEELQTLVSSR